MSISIRVAVAALALALPSLVAGQDQPRSDRPDSGALFDRLDANKDGFVTKDEIPQQRQRYLERLLRDGDKDKDGKLTREELAAALRGQPRPAAPEGQPDRRRPVNADQLFSRFDTNNNGKLDAKDEIPSQLLERFKQADKDGDGAVSKEEFQRFARTQRPAQPPQPAGLAARGVDSILFRTLDADHDGRISAEELAGATAALKKLDRNGDGALSVPELAGPRSPGAVQRIQQGELVRRLEGLFRERDKNQDGKISKEEAPEAWQRYFDRLDRNSDGVLDKAEAAQVVRRFIGNRPSDRPQDGARPRRPADTDKPAAKDKPRDTDKPAAKDRPRDKDKPADKD